MNRKQRQMLVPYGKGSGVLCRVDDGQVRFGSVRAQERGSHVATALAPERKRGGFHVYFAGVRSARLVVQQPPVSQSAIRAKLERALWFQKRSLKIDSAILTTGGGLRVYATSNDRMLRLWAYAAHGPQRDGRSHSCRWRDVAEVGSSAAAADLGRSGSPRGCKHKRPVRMSLQ